MTEVSEKIPLVSPLQNIIAMPQPAKRNLSGFMTGLSAHYQVELNGRLHWQRRLHRPFQILIYHRVNDYRDPFFMEAVPVAFFEKQIAYLARHFSVLSLEELIRRSQEESLPENGLAITFDDGYRDFYQYALPILWRYGLPASLFVATTPLQDRRPLWYDQVFHAFKYTHEESLDLPWAKNTRSSLVGISSRLSALKIWIDYLRRVSFVDRVEMVQQLLQNLAVDASEWREENAMLTWQELRELRQHGIQIGSHTVTHPILTRVAATQLEVEVYESKKLLEEKLQCAISTFAYPNGNSSDFDEVVKSAVRRAGYRCAVTTIRGNNDRTVHPFELRRIAPHGNSLREFSVRLLWYRLSL